MVKDTFSVGDEVTAVSQEGEVMRMTQVVRICRSYFETSDGAKWRSLVPGHAVRVPEGPDAPTLRHRRKDDQALVEAVRTVDSVSRWRPGPGGFSRSKLKRVGRLLGV